MCAHRLRLFTSCATEPVQKSPVTLGMAVQPPVMATCYKPRRSPLPSLHLAVARAKLKRLSRRRKLYTRYCKIQCAAIIPAQTDGWTPDPKALAAKPEGNHTQAPTPRWQIDQTAPSELDLGTQTLPTRAPSAEPSLSLQLVVTAPGSHIRTVPID